MTHSHVWLASSTDSVCKWVMGERPRGESPLGFLYPNDSFTCVTCLVNWLNMWMSHGGKTKGKESPWLSTPMTHSHVWLADSVWKWVMGERPREKSPLGSPLPWPIHMCDLPCPLPQHVNESWGKDQGERIPSVFSTPMTHSHVWLASSTDSICEWVMGGRPRGKSPFGCPPRCLIRMCDLPHPLTQYVNESRGKDQGERVLSVVHNHDSFTCVTCLVHWLSMWMSHGGKTKGEESSRLCTPMTHSHVWLASSTDSVWEWLIVERPRGKSPLGCVPPCLIHMCDLPRPLMLTLQSAPPNPTHVFVYTHVHGLQRDLLDVMKL